jgi:hypothetical protein
MKYAATLLILLLVPAAIGCGSSPAAQAITPAIATEIEAHDKQVQLEESAQGGADRRPIE